MHSCISIALIIILLFPVNVLAHGLSPSLDADPGRLPGDLAYIVERPAEWLSVNLFTVSTKKKQAKKLAFSSERVAEIGGLIYVPDIKEKYLSLALSRYRNYVESAEGMAEKIVFIDGNEIAVAGTFEEETRLQEKYLRELKEGAPVEAIPSEINDALLEARAQNEKIFTFMVEKYQASEADIRKHRTILSKHITLVREALLSVQDEDKIKKVSDLLEEAEDHRKAGLNLRAYEIIKQAKDLVY